MPTDRSNSEPLPTVVATRLELRLAQQGNALRDIREINHIALQASIARVQLVARARELGCSWSQISEVLGVSKQAAWQRYERFDDPELLNGKPAK